MSIVHLRSTLMQSSRCKTLITTLVAVFPCCQLDFNDRHPFPHWRECVHVDPIILSLLGTTDRLEQLSGSLKSWRAQSARLLLQEAMNYFYHNNWCVWSVYGQVIAFPHHHNSSLLRHSHVWVFYTTLLLVRQFGISLLNLLCPKLYIYPLDKCSYMHEAIFDVNKFHLLWFPFQSL